jgi:hypothetical protein
LPELRTEFVLETGSGFSPREGLFDELEGVVADLVQPVDEFGIEGHG